MERYLIYGTGKSGICAAGLLKRNNLPFVFFDENPEFDTEAFRLDHPEFKDTKIWLGQVDEKLIDSVDTVVMSPGVPLTKENVEALKKAGKKLTGELELGFTYEKGQVVAITGTNGKTTTTSLAGHILKMHYRDVFVAGNIGDPYTECADRTTEDSVTVLEVSSFQLETIHTFAPKVSAILNITPDHLDRHGSMECYIKVKESITSHQKMGDICILNYEDEELRDFGEHSKVKAMYFSSSKNLESGLYLDGDNIIYGQGDIREVVIDTGRLNILGKHNYENAMAAIAICICMDVPMEVIREGLTTFTAVEHRIEFVREKDGVRYYNDSKGTNTDAGIKAIEAMQWPIVLIAGGYDKKADYTEWVKTFEGKVKHVLLIGQSARDIADCAEKNGFTRFSFENSFEDAIDSSIKIARDGDCVLLSPACASWGMFKNFEERGRLFKERILSI